MNFNWQGQGDGGMQSPGTPQNGLAGLGDQRYQRLVSMGYTGPQRGTDEFAALREQGQRPYMDFRQQWRQDNPGQNMFGGQWGGQGGGQFAQNWQMPDRPAQPQWQPGQQWGQGQPQGQMPPMPGRPDPRPMNPGVAVGEPNGLAGLARRPEQMIRR